MGISDTIQAMPYQDARENAPSVWFENSLSDGSGSLSNSFVDTGDEDDSRSQANLLKADGTFKESIPEASRNRSRCD